MKPISLLILFFFSITGIAQDYQITFTATGASTTIDSLMVTNAAQGTHVTLFGSDVLRLKGTLGVTSKKNQESSLLSIAPNPSKESCIVEFEMEFPNFVYFSIFDQMGRKIINHQKSFQVGSVSYHVTGGAAGYYKVVVLTGDKLLTGTLIRTSTAHEGFMVRDEFVGNPINPRIQKSEPAAEVQMQYNTGERLIIKSFSGNYSTITSLIPTQNQMITSLFAGCTDGDGNHYPVVQIWNQLWMAENLKATKYLDGTEIPHVTNDLDWSNLSSPGYCWYNNDPQGDFTYGALYNWYAANVSNLCPSGWQLPSDADYLVLQSALGGSTVAGEKMKESGPGHWLTNPYTSASNESGFTALPAGSRFYAGAFVNVTQNGYWWSSYLYSPTSASCISLSYESDWLYNFSDDVRKGLSVRCVKTR